MHVEKHMFRALSLFQTRWFKNDLNNPKNKRLIFLFLWNNTSIMLSLSSGPGYLKDKEILKKNDSWDQSSKLNPLKMLGLRVLSLPLTDVYYNFWNDRVWKKRLWTCIIILKQPGLVKRLWTYIIILKNRVWKKTWTCTVIFH